VGCIGYEVVKVVGDRECGNFMTVCCSLAEVAGELSHPVFRLKLNAFLYVCQDEVSHIKRQIVE
jgi:hypothetical protein